MGSLGHRRPRRLSGARLDAITAGLAVLTTLLLLWLRSATMPTIVSATYTLNGVIAEPLELPFRFDSGDDEAVIEATIVLDRPRFSPNRFHLLFDDCIDFLDVNGVAMEDFPDCAFDKGRVENLGEFLRPGRNEINVRVSNNGGSGLLDVRPALTDPLHLAFIVLLLAVGAAYLVVAFGKRPGFWSATSAMLAAGVAIRCLYVLATPYWIRGHDTDGHIEYINYMADHLTIPPPDAGWEFWQPPLYYAIGAAWTLVARFFGAGSETILQHVQFFSLVLSVAMLFLGARLAKMIFPDPKDDRLRAIAVGFLAFFPGLVFSAARINNDVLMQAFGFLFAVLLFAWWRRPAMPTLCAAAAAAGCAMLAKQNGLLLVPPLLLTVAFASGLSWKQKAKQGIIALLIVGVVGGWFTAWRFAAGGTREVVSGNVESLQDELLLPNDVAAYATFNPAAMIAHPFNNPWRDDARRMHFWEYWYRSAFFGEFNHKNGTELLASWIIGLSFVSLLCILAGIAWSIMRDRRRMLPLLLLTFFLLLGHAMGRFHAPYSTTQDFRYSVAILAPAAIFLALGYSRLSARVQAGVFPLLTIFLGLCAIFLASI